MSSRKGRLPSTTRSRIPRRPGRRSRNTLWWGVTGALVVAIAGLAWTALYDTRKAPPAGLPPGIQMGTTPQGDPYIGSPQAPVTVEEFGDFQCPFCGEFARETEPRLLATYVTTGTVRLVWHTMAFIGPESILSGEAARCAQDQGKFWGYHDALYRNQGRENSGAFAIPRLLALAPDAGLDAGAFRACLGSAKYRAEILERTRAAQQRGITVTPTFLINGDKVTGALSFSQMTPLIEAAIPARK